MSSVSMRLLYSFAILIACSGTAIATKERPHLPCEYSGTLSRKYPNTAFPLRSDRMKRRATKKVDVTGPVLQADIRGAVGLEVLVGPNGSVVSAKGAYGHPMLVREVESAVRQWTFKPLRENNAPVAYVGHLDFTLCNIGCAPRATI